MSLLYSRCSPQDDSTMSFPCIQERNKSGPAVCYQQSMSFKSTTLLKVRESLRLKGYGKFVDISRLSFIGVMSTYIKFPLSPSLSEVIKWFLERIRIHHLVSLFIMTGMLSIYITFLRDASTLECSQYNQVICPKTRAC